MKGKTIGRGLTALTASMALGLGVTACSRDYVVGYLYATNSKAIPGLITAYAVDYQSGQLTQLADSPIPAGGNNSVALVASPNGKYLYIVNHDTSSLVECAIGTDGKLYPENTYSVVQGSGLTGSYPTAAAVDAAGKFLYVVFTYQNGYTTVRPGPGGIATFPINSNGSLGAPLTNTTIGTTSATPLPYIPLGNNPAGLNIPASGGFVYVIDQESSGGRLLSFAENTPTGTLTAVGAAGGLTLGTMPSAITSNPSGKNLYVTDSASNKVYTLPVSGGIPAVAPTPAMGTSTGITPDALTIDPRGKFLYVANYGSNTVTGYTIDATSGSLTAIANGGTLVVGTGPNCVTVDPALGIYLYTSNFINNSISAAQLDPKAGSMIQVQGTPFTSQTLPTCVVAVVNGAHTTQLAQ